MIIEYDLEGSKMLHKGIFETTGFWVRFEEEGEHVLDSDGNPTWRVDGYKIYGHSTFAFYHTDKEKAVEVYNRLLSVLRGASNVDIENVGYFRKLNK